MTKRQKAARLGRLVDALLDTVPAHSGIPTFGDCLAPENGPAFDAACDALWPDDEIKPEVIDERLRRTLSRDQIGDLVALANAYNTEATGREEVAYWLGVAATLRAVREARGLLAGDGALDQLIAADDHSEDAAS